MAALGMTSSTAAKGTIAEPSPLGCNLTDRGPQLGIVAAPGHIPRRRPIDR
jgi:hypothetical protein